MIKKHQGPPPITVIDGGVTNKLNTDASNKQIEHQQQSSCCHQCCCVSIGPGGGISVLDTAVNILWVLTPVVATLSLVVVCIAITTNQWLHSEEKMPNANYNGTGEKIYLSKHTVSGLWTLCYTNPGEQDMQCFNIDYFPREEYSPDPNDSTMAIPYAVTKSAAFYIAAAMFLFVAEFCCCFGHFARQRRIFTFISGIIFIISGLLMLFGLVMYISVFKAEIGSKLRPRSQLQPALFTYRYGFSFILIVFGFMSTEMAGICAIFLYIYWHQQDWDKKIERHKHSNSTPSSHNMMMMMPPSGAILPVPPPPSLLEHSSNHPGEYIIPCQKHYRPPMLPLRRYSYGSGSGSNMTSPPPPPPPHHHMPPPPPCMRGHYSTLPRRHHDLEEEEYPPCNSHEDIPCNITPRSRSQGALATIDSGQLARDSYYSSYQQVTTPGSNFSRDATCNTVSTTADINCDYPQHEFVSFNVDERPTTLIPNSSSNINMHERKREYSYETLRKTTPV